jgi:hypothetical protein
MPASVVQGQEDNPLVGIWTLDEGYQITELLFRSDGGYQLDTNSTDTDLDYSLTERGRYQTSGQTLTLTPYDYLGEPEHKLFQFQISGESLSLVRLDYELSYVYQYKPGSTADVLAREQVDADLVGTWIRSIPYSGTEAYTFRPGGYFVRVSTPEDSQFLPDFLRGRYTRDGSRLTLTPYSGVDAAYELDFFGNTLTLVTADQFSVAWYAYEGVPGSPAEVRTKAEEARAFVSREHWHVGVWEIHDDIQTVDLTIRPDGHYVAHELTDSLPGVVRGRYTLEPTRIQLSPFVGQDIYARSNGEFGKVERTRELDYYDGELQFIDLAAISQSVTLARKRPETEAIVVEAVRQAQAERARDGWYLGIWEVNDPVGWMAFTFRPDQRYIAKAGADGVPGEVERGYFRVAGEKLTLAPYAGLGQARGFELDLYEGDLFLVGDLARLVVARKMPESEIGVAEKTRAPVAMQGERGSILGPWTADLPGQSAELVFRPDGQFRLSRCSDRVLSHDYGLYTVDMTTRTLVSDSRFVAVQTLGLDFYADTLTIFGGTLGPPSTYTVNLGTVDAAIAASLADDAEEAKVDAAWLLRVPIGPRDPKAVQVPTADIPADPQPGHLFELPIVFSQFAFYRRLLPGFVYFNELGVIRSVPVVNTREWYFFTTGRVLVRFRNYRATFTYPITTVDISDTWGAYRIGPRPLQQDILHLYADNGLFIETDAGEQIEMTLEDGRRNLFWNKDFQLLSDWAAEQRSVPCPDPAHPDPSLMNTGLSLSSGLVPDEIPDEPSSEEPPTEDPPPSPPPVYAQTTIELSDRPLTDDPATRQRVSQLLAAISVALTPTGAAAVRRITLHVNFTATQGSLAGLEATAKAAGGSWGEQPLPAPELREPT